MSECSALAAWAQALPIEAPDAASDNFILNRLGFMQATLPSKGVDEATGEKRTAVYVSILRGHSRTALEYMADRACRELRWFPTPKDCLDLIADYGPPITERETTLRLCSSFAHVSLATWIENVREGQPIGDVPNQWQRIAIEQGVLRRLEDGTIVSRALYHGPFKAYRPAAVRLDQAAA